MSDVAPGYLLPRRATLLAGSGLMLSLFLVALNTTVVATALPSVVGDLGGLDSYSWVFTAYILGSSVTVPLFGRLSDIHGRRPYYVAGLALFLVGSAAGGAAGSMGELIAARAVQGLGGGAMLSLGFTTIGDLVPPASRGRWQAVNGAVFSAASVLGPLAGGTIADHLSWRWVFFSSLPLCVIALALGATTLRIPPHPGRARRVDGLGAALMLGGLACLMLATVDWGNGQAFAGPGVGLPLLGAVALAAAFVIHERRAPEPFLPLELLDDKVVRLTCVVGLLTGATHFGAITYVPLFAQDALGASPTAAALVLMPLMLGIFASIMASGPAITHTGRYRWALLAAPPVIGLGYAALAALGAASAVWTAAAAAAVVGLGLGLVAQNLVLVAQNSAPSRHLGSATATVTLCRNVGGALGVAVMGALMASGLDGAVSGAGAAAPVHGVASDVLAHAFHPVFLLGAALMVVTWWIAARVPERPLREAVREDAGAPQPAPAATLEATGQLVR